MLLKMLVSYFEFIFFILNLRIPTVNLLNFTTSTTTTEGMEDIFNVLCKVYLPLKTI